MPAAPARRPAEAAAPAAGTPGAGQTPGAAEKREGPAQVRVVRHGAQPIAEQTRVITGEVKNEGGETARNVTVFITVTEVTQGDRCLTTEVSVSPADLPPGESGSFSFQAENPCFFGEVRIELEPRWY
jgi:hypothetical protein